MALRRSSDRKLWFVWHTLAPICLAFVAAAAGIWAILVWSADGADRTSFERQRSLVSLVLQQSVTRIPHDQESVTVWDDAVKQVKGPLDPAWLDENLGVWMRTYFGHDHAYVLNERNHPIYAMVDGERRDAFVYIAAARAVAPLVAELRKKLADGAKPEDNTVLTTGAADLAIVSARPAIVSVKPIVPSTSLITQEAGTEFVHVSIRFLDGSFLSALSRQYMFEGARFSWRDDHGEAEASEPLRNRTGETVGYFVWKPFRPGANVYAETAPTLAGALTVVALILTLLILRLRRGSAALEASEAQAKHLAFHDTLTGLPNRALFEERLDRALAEARRNSRQLALLYLDLDRFKQVNDTLGHPAGDALIASLAQRLEKEVRETDTVARLGGDEFAVIQTDVSSSADIDALCTRLIAAATKPFSIGASQAFVGVSIGVALAPGAASDRSELTRKADIALYHAKANGRGRHVVFGEAMDAVVQRRRAIERDLRTALDVGGQLEVVYQPLYSALTKEITGAEALVRWNHPSEGRLSPALFIPVAEESGLIEPLGEWVLRNACKAAIVWQRGIVCVNVSSVQLRNPGFADTVLAILSETGLDPRRLELEITETVLLDDTSKTGPIIEALRHHGVRIALDDFGTGYSSLSHLRQLQVDRVKIDRSFVQGLDGHSESGAIVQAIVDLAQATGLKITAEGVETAEQSHFLARIGCHELQGFLLARPMSLPEIDVLLGVERRVTPAPERRRQAA